MSSLILIEVATNESRPFSVEAIVSKYLPQTVKTIEVGSSDEDEAPSKPISPPSRNKVDEAIEIVTLFTTDLDKSEKIGQNETIF